MSIFTKMRAGFAEGQARAREEWLRDLDAKHTKKALKKTTPQADYLYTQASRGFGGGEVDDLLAMGWEFMDERRTSMYSGTSITTIVTMRKAKSMIKS